jgi:hypothetical protein
MNVSEPTYKAIVEGILFCVGYKDWKFEVVPVKPFTGVPAIDENGNLFLRVTFMAPDNVTGREERQYGRWWLIEYGSHPTQIVQCAWLAVQRAEMHEVAERFKYKGAAIFNRHLDVEELVKISDRVD